MELYPKELFRGCETMDQRVTRMARFVLLEELGFFGEESNIKLSLDDSPGTFPAKIRRKFSGMYGNVNGCDPADIEVAALMLNVDEIIYPKD